jgi:hypothetical protein
MWHDGYAGCDEEVDYYSRNADEPGVESLLCSAYGSFAITTLPWFHNTFGIPHTWAAFIIFWGASVFV